MRLIFATLALCAVAFGQGTPLTPGTMTSLSPSGYSLQIAGFDKAVWVQSKHCVAFWGNYKTIGVTSEAQDALFCYSYADNRTYLLASAGAFHAVHGTPSGHNWGTMFHDTDADAITWIASSGSNAPDFQQDLFRFDLQGLTLSRMPIPTTSGTKTRVWLDGNIVYKAATYDPVNHRAVFFPNYQNSTGSASVCDLRSGAMTCVNSATTNGPAATDEPAVMFNATTNTVWEYDETNFRYLNAAAPASGWTAPTTTCVGADCVAGSHPPGRHYASIAYSTASQKFLFLGGITGTGGTAFTDIWTFTPSTGVWNEECSANCGYTNDASQPNSTFNRLVYDPDDDAFVFLQYAGQTVKVYALTGSSPLNYGRNSVSYAPPTGSLNRTAPPTSPTTSNAQTQAFHLSMSASGSNYYLARVETGIGTDSTACSLPVPYVYSSASSANLPSGTQATGCAGMGFGSANWVASHPYTANINGTQWIAFEKHNYSGASNDSAVFAGTYNSGTGAWSTALIGCTAGSCPSDSQYPVALVAAGTTPTLAVIEQATAATFTKDQYLYVYQYTGSWGSPLGNVKLNIGGAGTQATGGDVACTAANACAAVWAEQQNTDRSTLATVAQVYAKVWNGSAWSQMGSGSLNVTAGAIASYPKIISYGGQWCAAWTETSTTTFVSLLYVKCYTAGTNSWALLGSGALNANATTGIAYHPTLATDGANLYLGWEEQSAWGQLNKGNVKSWNGTAWSVYNSGISKSSSGAVANFSIVYAGGVQASWLEKTWGNTDQVYAQAVSPANSLTITNNGSTVSNYPVQIGRVFAQGEIPSGVSPQASVNGLAVSTQVDVKNRWSDGSLKHALVSFLVPTFTSGATYSITFAAGSTVGNTALTKTAMLDPAYDFDAVISLTKNAVTKTASARTMLNAGDYTVWASGPIATTILLGRHDQSTTCGGNAASVYDFGFDSFCAFRPLFEATFWPGLNKVYVRYIGEIANTEQLESVAVDSMLLTSGSASPSTWYTHASSLTMHAGSRWTKTTWIGGAPPAASYNHNVAYLASAKAVANYDPARTISGSAITTRYTAWTASSKDLYGKGVWDIPLNGGGGHDHVGPHPAWVACWLYTGDSRCQEISIGQAELLASLETNYREGKAGKKLDQAGAISGVGFPVSLSGRPTTQWVNGINYSSTAVADRIVPVGTVTEGSWGFDVAHMPDPYTAVYLTTGEHFYLDQMQFLATFAAHYVGGINTTDWHGRGPTGKEGGIADKANQMQQLRGQAWNFRNRVEVAAWTPDAATEKAYWTQLVADAIAMWEGQRGITTTSYNGNAEWNFGALTVNPASGIGYWDYYSTGGGGSGSDGDGGHFTTPPALHFWDMGNIGLCQNPPNDLSVTKSCVSTWWENYLLYALGRGKELGFATSALLTWLAPQATDVITDANSNPWFSCAYRYNTFTTSNTRIQTWANMKLGYASSVQTETACEPGGAGSAATDNGNAETSIAATAMTINETNGSAAWTWVNANIYPSIGNDPKWAILPRGTVTASCSLSASGTGPNTVGQSVTLTVSATSCGAGTLTYSATGLPTGLSINSTTGAITGTYTAGGAFTPTISVTDGGSNAASVSPSITVNGSPTITSSGALTAGTQGTAYSRTLTTSGGTGTLTCSLVSGSLPTGLSFSGCTISGTPTTANTYTFTAHVTDSNSITGPTSSSLSITINPSGGTPSNNGGARKGGKLPIGGKISR